MTSSTSRAFVKTVCVSSQTRFCWIFHTCVQPDQTSVAPKKSLLICWQVAKLAPEVTGSIPRINLPIRETLTQTALPLISVCSTRGREVHNSHRFVVEAARTYQRENVSLAHQEGMGRQQLALVTICFVSRTIISSCLLRPPALPIKCNAGDHPEQLPCLYRKPDRRAAPDTPAE